ncbi:MAG: hypothetical protein GX271_02850 [Clostridiales bacterium]|nr:hypothetical protein [Clostridiales bacterium]
MVIGLTVVIGFATISIISGLNNAKEGLVIGIVGILLFFLALFGFVLSYKELRKRDIYYRFPLIGIISNGLMLVILMIIYIIGLYQ